jgi:biotin transport system substrate-specific component
MQQKGVFYMKTRELCQIAVFAAVICVCSPLSIPMPGDVPITLQAWVISLAGLVLGAKKGTIATLIYVLIGACGLPVFSGFLGGIGIIAGPRGGFILSFPVVALLAGLGEQKGGIVWTLLGLTAGTVFNLAAGLFWFEWFMGYGLAVSFGYAVAPFILISIIRTAVLPLIGKTLKTALRKANLVVYSP